MKVNLNLDYSVHARFVDMASGAQCTVDQLASTIVTAFFGNGTAGEVAELLTTKHGSGAAVQTFEPNGTEVLVLELLKAKSQTSNALINLSGRSAASINKALARLLLHGKIRRSNTAVTEGAGRPPYLYSLPEAA